MNSMRRDEYLKKYKTKTKSIANCSKGNSIKVQLIASHSHEMENHIEEFA